MFQSPETLTVQHFLMTHIF